MDNGVKGSVALGAFIGTGLAVMGFLLGSSLIRFSHSKLGKIRSANQGQLTITDRDSNTPHIKNVRVVAIVDYYLSD